MTVLVHITGIENEKSIRKSGINHGDNNLVFFMPHMQDFLISHQWARELKRSGVKNFAAVDFCLPSDEQVWFGKYNEQHEKMELGKAISLLRNADNFLGYEFFIDRKIKPDEVLKVRKIPRPMGWRYQPNAHGKKPCPCPICLQSGGFKTNNLKEARTQTLSKEEAKCIIATSSDEDQLWEAVCRLSGKWKRVSPSFLERVLEFEDEYLLCALVELLSEYRHPLARDYLARLANSEKKDVRALADEYLQKI